MLRGSLRRLLTLAAGVWVLLPSSSSFRELGFVSGASHRRSPHTVRLSPLACRAVTDDKFRQALGVFQNGRGNVQAALPMFQELADAGHARSKVAIGKILGNGAPGVPKDEARAVEYFREAHEAGDSQGSLALGLMMKDGRGTDCDKPGAALIFKRCAEDGNTGAMQILADMLRLGDGIPKDEQGAMQWMVKAADSQGQLTELMKAIRSGTADPKDMEEIENRMQNMNKAVEDAPEELRKELGAKSLQYQQEERKRQQR
mmetsp:Transcript_7778/g.17064  ORF Transcript_7778/g.17064 Transcript_7778/m.17064 type:complete len:259 (-) Transcript_7778:121-897(-)